MKATREIIQAFKEIICEIWQREKPIEASIITLLFAGSLIVLFTAAAIAATADTVSEFI